VGFALGSLEGVQFGYRLFLGCLHMGRHVTGPHTPSGRGIRERQTILTGSKFAGLLTTFTFFNNGMAGATIEFATFFAHEGAIHTFSNTCTKHFDHILSFKAVPTASLKISGLDFCRSRPKN
jgi:hypothetical protein